MLRIDMVLLVMLLQSLIVAAVAARGDQAQAPDTNEKSQLFKQLSKFGKGALNELENTAEALKPQQILLSIENGITTTRANFDIHIASWANDYPSLGRSLELAKSKAEELGLTQVALDIERWVELHPWKAALYTTGALGLVAPEIFSIPALEALGFGLAGVRAGSIASKIQSIIGPVASRSVFAIWQSARMGGYGVEYVNGGVRAVIALTDAAVAHCNPLKDCKGLIGDGGKGRSRESRAAITPATI